MSRENVEIVRHSLANAAESPDAVWGVFDEDVEWDLGYPGPADAPVSGTPIDLRHYGVMWIRDGKIVRALGYPSRRQALAAVGRDESDAA